MQNQSNRQASRRSRARSRSRRPAPHLSYESPWLQFDPMYINAVLNDLDECSQKPFTFNEFVANVNGAAEHDHGGHNSRSVSHFLSTLARAVTAMIHARHEGHPRQTDRQTDGRTDGQTDRQTDRQTHYSPPVLYTLMRCSQNIVLSKTIYANEEM